MLTPLPSRIHPGQALGEAWGRNPRSGWTNYVVLVLVRPRRSRTGPTLPLWPQGR
jgi:hypothetical protein